VDRGKVVTHSPEETERFAEEFARSLSAGSVVTFSGELGAGKTTFVRGFTRAFSDEDINSPTFTYLNIYSGSTPLYHFDLYRLKSPDEFLTMGFDEYFHLNGITLIEWSEKIRSILPKEIIHVAMTHAGKNKRSPFVTSDDYIKNQMANNKYVDPPDLDREKEVLENFKLENLSWTSINSVEKVRENHPASILIQYIYL